VQIQSNTKSTRVELQEPVLSSIILAVHMMPGPIVARETEAQKLRRKKNPTQADSNHTRPTIVFFERELKDDD